MVGLSALRFILRNSRVPHFLCLQLDDCDIAVEWQVGANKSSRVCNDFAFDVYVAQFRFQERPRYPLQQ